MSKKFAMAIATEFFRLAEVASRHGGLWVSAAGGTANVIAGEIARVAGISFEDAHDVLNQVGAVWVDQTDPVWEVFGWYALLAAMQPRVDDFEDYRFDARTIVRAAIRAADHFGRLFGQLPVGRCQAHHWAQQDRAALCSAARKIETYGANPWVFTLDGRGFHQFADEVDYAAINALTSEEVGALLPWSDWDWDYLDYR